MICVLLFGFVVWVYCLLWVGVISCLFVGGCLFVIGLVGYMLCGSMVPLLCLDV